MIPILKGVLTIITPEIYGPNHVERIFLVLPFWWDSPPMLVK